MTEQRQCDRTDPPPLFETLENLLEKTLCAAEQHRDDVVQEREEWKKLQEIIDVTKFVFMDETWTKTNRTPLYGRAPIGKRLIDHVPHGHCRIAVEGNHRSGGVAA